MNDKKEKHATFTLGPWVIIPERNGGNIQGKATNHLIAHMTMASVPDERLIAAAPEMYQLLRDVLVEYQAEAKAEGWDLPIIGEEVREVLAKVDGGEG